MLMLVKKRFSDDAINNAKRVMQQLLTDLS